MVDHEDSSYDLASPEPEKRPGPPKKASPPEPGAGPAGPGKAGAGKAEEAERYCPYCGFTFRGRVKARCPECAAPMDSPTDLYQFADARWVRECATGLMLLIPGIALHVAGAVLRWTGSPESKGVAHMAAAALVAAGVVLATRKERGPLVKAAAMGRVGGPSKLVPWVRVLALAALVVWAVLGVITFGPGVSRGTLKALVMLVMLCQVILAGLLSYVVSGMATRLPNDTLATHAIYTGWATAALCLTLLALQWLELTTQVHLMFFTCSFPMILVFVVILSWAMITLLRLALEMRTAAAAGDQIAVRRAARMAGRKG